MNFVCRYPWEFMFRLLLSLALVLMQVLSWGSLPLYVCLESDGGICIDGGPASCHCCRPKDEVAEPSAAPKCANGHCHHDSKSVSVTDSVSSMITNQDDCDCLHLPISQSSEPTVVSTRLSTNAARHFALLTTDLSDFGALPMFHSSIERDIRHSLLDGHSLLRSVTQTVVLRC